MPKPLRLLFVTKHLGGQGGGAERVLSLIASELANRGHEIAIATFDPTQGKDFYWFDPRISRDRLGVGDALSKSGIADFLGHARALRGLLRKRKPDVAIGFMHSSFVPLGLAAVSTGVPIVASEHTAFDHYHARGVERALVRWTAPLFAAFTATSDQVRAGFPAAIARRMTVIPNPVVSAELKGSKDDARTRTLLSVGVLRGEKGHDTLLTAFAEVAREFPQWTLRIVGDGPRRDELERQASKARLKGQVTFAGAVADVGPEYAAADLFVTPSAYESFGLATAEALATGLPAIGFADCPGTNELIQEGKNGLLVSGRNRTRALADGLAKLMGDDAMRAQFGQAGPASVAKYSLEAVANRWEELLSSVARKNRSGG